MNEKIMHLPMIMFTILASYGIYIIFCEEALELRMEKYKRTLTRNEVANAMLQRTGLNIDAKVYYTILYTVALIVLALFVVRTIIYFDISFLILGIVIAAVIIFCFRPTEYLIGTVASPFATITRILSTRRRERMDQEIYSSCIVLKNLAIVQEDSPLSTDKIFETLEQNAKVLRPVYQTTLSKYRTGEASKAFEYFWTAIGTTNAKNFASLLSKLDYINPADLKEQAIAIQEAMAEARFTARYKKAQTNGIITMGLSTVAVMLIIMNFLMITIFMDTMSDISGLM